MLSHGSLPTRETCPEWFTCHFFASNQLLNYQKAVCKYLSVYTPNCPAKATIGPCRQVNFFYFFYIEFVNVSIYFKSAVQL